MPLTADLYTRNEYGEMEDDCTLLDGRMLRCYEGEILRALINNQMLKKPRAASCIVWRG